jgi:hypothetical protein
MNTSRLRVAEACTEMASRNAPNQRVGPARFDSMRNAILNPTGRDLPSSAYGPTS